jgi:hypothetical protein
VPYASPNDCPKCGRGSKHAYIQRHGACATCRQEEQTGGRDSTLTGKKRKEALARIAAWLERHPSPWDRANYGLFMGVPVSDKARWP